MIPKRFQDIEFSDLEALLDNQVTEGKTIEYKREIVTNANSDKDPFLEGISAFANTVGGDFIIGIEDENSIPIKLMGIRLVDANAEILRLHQILQSGLEPRLPSVDIKEIRSPDGASFLVIRVGESWIAPHRVKANNKFFGRNSKGKYPLDVSELRTSFMLSEQLPERIRNFRMARVTKIEKGDELPVVLSEGGKVIFHVIPVSAFAEPITLNLSEVYEKNLGILGSGWNNRINLDGVLHFSSRSEANRSYSQIFRNGSIELTYVFDSGPHDKKFIPSTALENELINFLRKCIEFFTHFGIEPPIFLFLTFIGIQDHQLAVNSRVWGWEEHEVDRKNLVLPEVYVDTYDLKVDQMLRPVFDFVWNAYGYSHCLNYDEEGVRLP